ncbi:hypothetical protein QYF36_010480 [Acer negundo]|nr:hypothetical protein QYF36_010480 [Acer negundo]
MAADRTSAIDVVAGVVVIIVKASRAASIRAAENRDFDDDTVVLATLSIVAADGTSATDVAAGVVVEGTGKAAVETIEPCLSLIPPTVRSQQDVSFVNQGAKLLLSLRFPIRAADFSCLRSSDFEFLIYYFTIMTLLEVITKASANLEPVSAQVDHPIILSADDIFLNLKPKLENPSATSLVNSVAGWEISQTDTQLIDTCKKFYVKLKRNLKDTNKFDKDEFIGILNPFLEKISENVLMPVGFDKSDSGYTRVLIEKIGFLMSRDVAGLVLEACVRLRIWELVEALILYGLVDHSGYSDLVMKLVAEKRSNLLSLCIKHSPDLGSSELLCFLKYFLCPHRDAYASMVSVRKEWESQALLAIEKARDEKLSRKKSRVAKEASILLMVAHDGFSASELCLHYLLASSNVDEMILSYSISKLNVKEMMSLIRYLGKWLKKFERFPQAGPCPEASCMLGLMACDWVPRLEVVVKCLGVMLDENFSSLVLHPEFHEELRSIEGVVGTLAVESRLCCSMATAIKNLGVDDECVQN